MMSQLKSLVLVVTVLILGWLCFVFIIFGGLDKFKLPIQIVVPQSLSGSICIRLTSNPTPESSSLQLKYWVHENGLVAMDENLLRSHRKKQFFRAANSTAPMVAIPDDKWFPIMSENDSKNNVSYTLYWLGTKESWMKSSEKNSNKPLCLLK